MTQGVGTEALFHGHDDLDFRRVAHIFLRTWPFIRPAMRHLVIFILISVVIALFSATLLFIITALMNGGIVGGKPLGQLHVLIYGLDLTVYVDVEELDPDARRSLRWLVILTTIPLVAVVAGGGIGLYYYSVWIFQGINQRMRVSLIYRLQAQSLTYHATARTGDAIYRVYQDSAMVTQIIRAIFLEPLMFSGRFLFAVAIVAAFDPLLAVILAAATIPILFLGRVFSSPLRRAFRVARERNSRLTSWIQESVLGVRVVKATRSEALRERSFREYSLSAFEAAFRSRSMLIVLGILAFGAIGLAVLVTQSMAAMWSNVEASTFARNILLGFGFAVWNLGSFSAATGRIGDGLGSINALISLWGRAQDMAVGLGRVYEVLDLEPEINDAPDAMPMPSFGDAVRFRDVSFAYLSGR